MSGSPTCGAAGSPGAPPTSPYAHILAVASEAVQAAGECGSPRHSSQTQPTSSGKRDWSLPGVALHPHHLNILSLAFCPLHGWTHAASVRPGSIARRWQPSTAVMVMLGAGTATVAMGEAQSKDSTAVSQRDASNPYSCFLAATGLSPPLRLVGESVHERFGLHMSASSWLKLIFDWFFHAQFTCPLTSLHM